MRVNPGVHGETRFTAISLLAHIADPGIVCTGPQMTRPHIRHTAVREETPGEVWLSQERAQRGAALLHDLDVEPDPRALLPHDLGDTLHQPAVGRSRVKGSEVILRTVPGSVTRHKLLIPSVNLVIVPGAMQRPGPRVCELTLSPVPG